MDKPSWRPSCSWAAVERRSQLNREIREFFLSRSVTEVVVPALSRSTVSDPHLDSFKVASDVAPGFLQTSPEFFLKRLLADAKKDLYSLAPVYRDEPSGRRHNCEFTMLEWYRVGWDDRQLMREVADLIHQCGIDAPVTCFSYRELFQKYLHIDPVLASLEELKALAHAHLDIAWDDRESDVWLHLLMSHLIEPKLDSGLVFITDFPASQAALARLGEDSDGTPVARRFEAYLDGVELANGYWELCNAEEYVQRFQRDNELRQQMGKPQMPLDRAFVDAMAAGLPDCAGVALGVDRLLMALMQVQDIGEVMPFPSR